MTLSNNKTLVKLTKSNQQIIFFIVRLNDYYFFNVKRKLLIFLMLLVGYIYLTAALDIGREESKKHYNSEQQDKIATLNDDFSSLNVALELYIPVLARASFVFYPTQIVKTTSSPVIKFPCPPNKLFIWHSILLI